MTTISDANDLVADRPATEPRTEAACPKCGHDVDHTTACPDGCQLCLTSPRTRLADRLRAMYGPSLRPDDPDHDGSMADWLRDADSLAEAETPMMMPAKLLRSEWPPNDGLRAGNPRFDDIFDSVRREGIREPLTINLGWFVIDGNHRLSAARQLGLERVPVRVWTGTEYLP